MQQNRALSKAEKTHRKKGGLNRTDIARSTRSQGGGTDLPRKTVREALGFVIGEITQTVLDGKVVNLTGFGTFEIWKRADSTGQPQDLRASSHQEPSRGGLSSGPAFLGARGQIRKIRSKSVSWSLRPLRERVK